MTTVERAHRGTSRVTLADVAREVGVDASTVSRVLRGHAPRIPETTRERVFAAAERLHYVPNANARSLASSSTRTLGLLIPSIGSSVYTEVVRGVTAAARESGYFVMIIDGSEVGSAAEAFRETVLGGRVDGLLIASGTEDDTIDEGLLSRTSRCVVLNRRIATAATSVILDDRMGMQALVRQLVALGHRDIAYVGGPRGVDTAQRRLAGFLDGMAEAGLPAPADRLLSVSYDESGGYDAAHELLAREARPTAIAAASALAAMGVIAACAEEGVRIPDDVSLNAFHDSPQAAYLVPPLSTVRMPLFELGAEGARLLVRQIAGEAVPRDVLIAEPAPELRPRASTAAPR